MTEYKDCLTKSAADYRMKNKTLTMMTARAAMTLLALFCILGGANAQKTLPYEYGFENMHVDDEGWSRVDCTEGTGIEDNVSHNGNYIFGFLYTTNPPQYLISPQFDGTTGMAVSFYYKNQMDDYPETFQVGYSTTNRSIDAFTWGNKVTANDEDRWYSLWECESSYSPPALVLSLSNARHPMLPAQSDSHRQRLPVACHPGSLPDNP